MISNKLFCKLLITGCLSMATVSANADEQIVTQLLQSYTSQGAKNISARNGQILWQKKFKRAGETTSRSCASCHTNDIKADGKHVKTSKRIKPMSPLVNPDRLTNVRKIEKWFKRNCKWTISRECSVQEKADFLAFINNKTNF